MSKIQVEAKTLSLIESALSQRMRAFAAETLNEEIRRQDKNYIAGDFPCNWADASDFMAFLKGALNIEEKGQADDPNP